MPAEDVQVHAWGNRPSVGKRNETEVIGMTEAGAEKREERRYAVNVGIPVPVSVFPFSGHKDSFFGDLHVMGRDGIAFYTETKSVTTRWLERDQPAVKVSTWEGTIARK